MTTMVVDTVLPHTNGKRQLIG